VLLASPEEAERQGAGRGADSRPGETRGLQGRVQKAQRRRSLPATCHACPEHREAAGTAQKGTHGGGGG